MLFPSGCRHPGLTAFGSSKLSCTPVCLALRGSRSFGSAVVRPVAGAGRQLRRVLMGIAFVTGTSTGIGMATAISLARAGHTVYAGMRNPQRHGELHEAVARENLGIHMVAHDVDGDAGAQDAIGQALAEAGRIDVLVNNAGIGTMGPVEETSVADFRSTMETNFFGALRCIQAVLPGMRERGSGCIVNVTSVAGRIAISPQAPYASSKWALEALSECLAQEVRSFGIRVAIVEPGVIATSIFGKMAPDVDG